MVDGPTAAHVVVADLERPRLDDGDRHHLAAVLRLRDGEAVSATDGRGGWRRCQFASSTGDLEVTSDLVRVPAPAPSITIGLALVKGERPEWAVQKLVELGVDRVVLFHAERSVVRWTGDRALRHLERLRLVARQALMQSRQVWLPEIAGVDEFGKLVAGGPAPPEGRSGPPEGRLGARDHRPAGPGGMALAAPGGGPPALDRPTVLIGPEGGWSPAEEASGLPTVSLGPSMLRTETAAVVAGSLLVALRSGLVGPR
jgi:16S rRNA (uracil1498-N3)-methyltransferase